MTPPKGRVVFISPGLTEPGGTARRSRLIAEGLAAAGWDVRVITRSGVLRRPRLERGERLRIVELPGFGLRRVGAVLFYLCAMPLALIWGVRARGFLSLQLMSTSAVAGIAARVLGRPFVAMASTGGELSETRYIEASRTARLRKRILGSAAWMVAQTPAVADQLIALTDRRRITVLPNPVAIPGTRPPLNGRPSFLYAGRLSEEKDLGTLLDAWLEIERPAGATLTLLGEGGAFRSVEPQLRARVASDPELEGSVEMPGWTRDVGAHLARCDFFVLPSLEEGMSNALLEACALGRIPIVSAIGPNTSIVGEDHPFVFSPGDAGALAETLSAVLATDHGELAEIGNGIAERVDGEFSSEAVVSRLENLLENADSARHKHS